MKLNNSVLNFYKSNMYPKYIHAVLNTKKYLTLYCIKNTFNEKNITGMVVRPEKKLVYKKYIL